MVDVATAAANKKGDEDSGGVPLSSVKTEDSSVLLECRSKRLASLEFSEALPFAAFASLLVEMMVRLDLVIGQVDELERRANFKEMKDNNEEVVTRQRTKQRARERFNLTFVPKPQNDLSNLVELKCCYRASIDGFSATSFHNCCDFKGPCVVIGYTNDSFKFGGFNPKGYRSADDYYETFDAFLFYWRELEEIKPVILPKVGGSGAALFDYARGGPQFGADGLLIGPPLAPVMGGSRVLLRILE
ncbi:hypothetical protein GIB67_013589 [Kingdonia uniflora]|uniref:TLDc domain-containing protein n=1 Tax=Kingdonia uniflora TaxID=39325 RepID=A0A7J7KV50_9MAGN|nr:hypothetical protein GIB67_013589 [Kingdonia uniflora]